MQAGQPIACQGEGGGAEKRGAAGSQGPRLEREMAYKGGQRQYTQGQRTEGLSSELIRAPGCAANSSASRLRPCAPRSVISFSSAREMSLMLTSLTSVSGMLGMKAGMPIGCVIEGKGSFGGEEVPVEEERAALHPRKDKAALQPAPARDEQVSPT